MKDLLYNFTETAMWYASGSMANSPRRQKYKETIGKIQKTMYSLWKRGVARPISNIDSFVKHANSEHNQEADHWAEKQGHRGIGPLGRR